MAEVSDEILMFYADGVLPPIEQARLEKLIAKDPGLACRLEAFHRTSAKALSPLFSRVNDAPVPERLLRAAMDIACAAEGSGQKPPPRAAMGFLEALIESVRGLLPQGTSPLAAAFVALGAVIVAGYGARTISQTVPDPQPFRIALETAQSGTKISYKTPDGERVVTPVMTFQDASGRYCRKYTLVRVSSGSQVAGIACRDEFGQWKIDYEVDSGRALRDGEHVTAGAGDLDDRIMEMIKGDALGRPDEDAVLKKGWKK